MTQNNKVGQYQSCSTVYLTFLLFWGRIVSDPNFQIKRGRSGYVVNTDALYVSIMKPIR